LSQDDHPVMYLSRKLTEAERRYSNIEREALAIVWATVRARHFLLGKKFMLRSDHKPLEYIFHPSRELPKVTSARLARWAIQLMAFDYEIMYVKGDSIPHVDALSRLSFSSDDSADKVDETNNESFIHWTETDILSLAELRNESLNDAILTSIMKRVELNRWGNC